MSLDELENKFFKTNKQKTNMLFQTEDCVNGLNLPCSKLFEIKSSGNMSCLELSLQWLSKAQRNGIGVLVDSECICSPEILKKYDIDIKELLYVQSNEPKITHEILYKLLELKDIRLIVVSTVTMLFPLVYDIKEVATLFNKLKEKIQESNASIIVVNPYYDLCYETFIKTINCQFKSKYLKRLKDEVEIGVEVNNFQDFNQIKEFSTSIIYNH